MYKFLVEKEKEQQFDIEKQFYHFADNSIYILIKFYKDGALINQLFVKLLDDLADYKKFFNNFYMKKGEIFFEPILLKASESLDIFSLAKASHSYALQLNLKEYFVLEKEAEKNGKFK